SESGEHVEHDRITSLNEGHRLVKVCVDTHRESSHFRTERKRPASSIGPRHPPTDVRPVTGRRDVDARVLVENILPVTRRRGEPVQGYATPAMRLVHPVKSWIDYNREMRVHVEETHNLLSLARR